MKLPKLAKAKNPLKLVVAGGFSSNVLTPLMVIEVGRKINGSYYRENILPTYLDALDSQDMSPIKKKATFMQDGAPCHTTNENLSLIKSRVQRVWSKGVWSGNRPDVN